MFSKVYFSVNMLLHFIFVKHFALERRPTVTIRVSKMMGHMKNYIDVGTHFREKIQM